MRKIDDARKSDCHPALIHPLLTKIDREKKIDTPERDTTMCNPDLKEVLKPYPRWVPACLKNFSIVK